MSGLLPTPVTHEETFLAAIYGELLGLRADLAAARGGERAAERGKTELREPAPRPATKKAAAKKQAGSRRT